MVFQTRIISILVNLILFTLPASNDVDHGTAIAFCANKDLIFIAVDSQINHENGFKSIGNKIHTLANTTWINSGLYSYSNEFNIDEIITEQFNIRLYTG